MEKSALRALTKLFAVFSAVLALSACSDLSGLLPSFDGEARASIEFSGLRGGAVVRRLAFVTPRLIVSGRYANTPPNRVEITIQDRDGKIVLEMDPIIGDLQDPDVIGEIVLTPQELETLSPELYHLAYKLYLDQEQVGEGKLPFFHAPGFPQSQNLILSTYPSVLVARGYGLLRAQILFGGLEEDYPDTYLRWTKDGQVLAEGYLRDGADMIPVAAPDKPGVFQAALDVYPYAPPAEGGYAFPAPLRNTVEAVVDRVPRAGAYDLIPEEDFYTLLHFNGTLDDAGQGFSAGYAASQSERPMVPGIRQGIFGLEYDPQQYLKTESFVLPLNEDRLIYPASIHLLGYLDFLPVDQDVSLFRTASADWAMELLASGSSELVLRVDSSFGSQEIRSLPGALRESSAMNLVLSYFPTQEGLLGAVLLNDGLLVGRGEISAPLTIPEGREESRLGGSFSGIIDEFGIRFRDGDRLGVLAGDIFLNSLLAETGVQVEYALSFESGLAQAYHFNWEEAELEEIPLEGKGDYEISPGLMNLGSGGSISLFQADDSLSSLDLRLHYEKGKEASKAGIRFVDKGNPQDWVILHLDGGIRTSLQAPSGDHAAPEEEGAGLLEGFQLRQEAGLWSLVLPGGRNYELGFDAAPLLELVNLSDSGFRIYSIAALSSPNNPLDLVIEDLGRSP